MVVQSSREQIEMPKMKKLRPQASPEDSDLDDFQLDSSSNTSSK